MLNKIAIIIVCLCALITSAYATPLIVLDPGHEPSHPGAMGTCGIKEVNYNDKIVKSLAKLLSQTYQVKLTREFGQEVNVDNDKYAALLREAEKSKWGQHKQLYSRPAIANLNNAVLFISIHHDSNSPVQIIKKTELCQGKGGLTLRDEFKKKYSIGYNVFVNDDKQAPERHNSLRLANLIGKEMLTINRKPSNYHVYPDGDCKSCRPIDKETGVWYEDLAVLRNAIMPAVLIEVGNIVDTDDEAIVNSDAFREKFSRAVKNAVDEYFRK